jgi:DNA-binding transcriptional ArsR family regulator
VALAMASGRSARRSTGARADKEGATASVASNDPLNELRESLSARLSATPQDVDSLSRDIARLAAALDHPLRVAIVLTLVRQGGDVSPTRLAEVLEVPLGNVAYHVRVLAKRGVLTLTRQLSVRSALQRYYAIDPTAFTTLAYILEALAAPASERPKAQRQRGR